MPPPRRASRFATAELANVAWEAVSALLFATAVAPPVLASAWPPLLFVASLAVSAVVGFALRRRGRGRLAALVLVRMAGWVVALVPVVDRTGTPALLAAAAFGLMAGAVRQAFYRSAEEPRGSKRSALELGATLRDRLAESASVVGIVAGHILMLFVVAFLRTTNDQTRNAWWQVLPWLALGGTLVFVLAVRAMTTPVLDALAVGADAEARGPGLVRAQRLPDQLALVNFAVWFACAAGGAFGFRTIFAWSTIDAALVVALGVLFAWAIATYQRAWHREILAPVVERLGSSSGRPVAPPPGATLRRRMLADFGMPLAFSCVLSLLASIGLYRALVRDASAEEMMALVGSFAALAVAAGWIVLRAARELSRPMSVLAHAADEVASGRLDAAVPRVDGPAEVAGLGDSIERMRLALRTTIAELEQERAGLERKVEARTAELSRALAELKEAQAALLHGEKMASLGQLVAGVAHEINNPLNAIAGSVVPLAGLAADARRALEAYENAENELPPSRREALAKMRAELDLDASLEDLAGIAAVIRRATDRAVRIVTDLLGFARAPTDPVPTDLHRGLDETLTLLGSHLRGGGVAVEKAYGELPEVMVRPGEVNQIFMNLLTNALQAVEGRSPATIRIETRADGGWVEVAIEDSGPGVPEAIAARIFDPFFTTKPAGSGTGLGLSISAQIAARHGGSLTVARGAMGGARFVLRAPAAPPPSVPSGRSSRR